MTDVLNPQYGRHADFIRRLGPVDIELGQIFQNYRVEGTPPPDGREVKMSAINWETAFGREWSGGRKDRIVDKLENRLGMNPRQAEYAALSLALTGYAPDRRDVPKLERTGVSLRTLDEILDDYNPRDRRWVRSTQESSQYKFFTDHFTRMKDREKWMVFSQEWRNLEYAKLSANSMEEFARKLAHGGTESRHQAKVETDGVARGRWMLEYRDEKTGDIYRDNEYSLFKIHLTNQRQADGSWGGFYVREDNLTLCIRDHTENKYDIAGPDNNVQYDDISIKTDQGGVYKLSDWFNSPGSWRSEDGRTKYNEVWMRNLLETWAFNKIYNIGVDYKKAMYDLKKLDQVYEDLFLLSQQTKIIFGVNMMEIIFGDALKFIQARSRPGGTGILSVANETGMATLTMMDVYYHGISDWKTLVEILGEDSDFFILDTYIGNPLTGKKGALHKFAERQVNRVGRGLVPLADGRTHLLDSTVALMNEAFDERTRKVKNPDAFIRLVNVFAQDPVDQVWQWTMRGALTEAVREKFDVKRHYTRRNPRTGRLEDVAEDDGASMSLAESNAWFFSRVMGGEARNDITTMGPWRKDKSVIMYHLMDDRRKRVDELVYPGNKYTVDMYKGAVVPPLEAITMQWREDLGNGQVRVYQKSLSRILSDLQRTGSALARVNKELANPAGLTPARIAWLDQEKARLDGLYKTTLGVTHPYADVMREYFTKHWRPGRETVELLLSGKEYLNLGMYFSDSIYGVNFKPEEWASGMLKVFDRHRSQWTRFLGVNLTEPTRDYFTNPITGRIQWITVPKVLSLFDYDVLDHPDFFKLHNGKPKSNFIQIGPRRYKRFYELDIQKMQNDRPLFAKVTALHEIAMAIRQHMINNQGDVRFTKNFYVDAINSLKTLDGITSRDIAWVRKKALYGGFWLPGLGTRDWGPLGFYLKWWLASGFYQKDDKEGMWAKALQMILSEAFAGANL